MFIWENSSPLAEISAASAEISLRGPAQLPGSYEQALRRTANKQCKRIEDLNSINNFPVSGNINMVLTLVSFGPTVPASGCPSAGRKRCFSCRMLIIALA